MSTVQEFKRDVDRIKTAPFAKRDVTAPFAKSPRAIDLNFDALFDAGIDLNTINRSVADQLNVDYDRYLNDGGNINDFTYVYTNIAKKGGLSAFTNELLKSFTESAPMVGGIVGGVKTGSKVPGPLKIPSMIALGGAGAFTGDKIGQKAVDALGFEDKAYFPQDRFEAKVGDILGGDVAFVMGAPYLLPAKKGQTLQNILVSDSLNNIPNYFGLKKVIKAPLKILDVLETGLVQAGKAAKGQLGKGAQTAFFGSEVVGSGGAALGGATADKFVPDSGITQFGGEVGGGLLASNSPTAILSRFIPSLTGSLKGQLGTDARETKLGQKLRKYFLAAGEDPDQIADTLEANIISESDTDQSLFSPERLRDIIEDLKIDLPELTPAQITGSPLLSRLQLTLSKAQGGADELLDLEATRRLNEGYEFIEQLAQGLESIGTVESVRAAMEIREKAFSEVLETELAIANERAIGAAQRLSDVPDFDDIGKSLSNNINQILKNANAQEKKLFDEVPEGEVDISDSFFDSINAIKGEFFLPKEPVDAIVGSELTRIAKVKKLVESKNFDPDKPRQRVTVKNMMLLRSKFLEAARKAYADDQFMAAKAYKQMSETVLDELDIFLQDDTSYALARAFSKGKNDAIRRTFVKDLLAKDKNAVDYIPDELIADKLFEGRNTAVILKTEQMRDAATFVQRKLDELNIDPELRILAGDDSGPVDSADLDLNLTQATRFAAKEIIDPVTGMVNERKAADFLNKYDRILTVFPQVKTMIEDGKQLEKFAKLTESKAFKENFEKRIKQNDVLARVIAYAEPDLAIAEAIGAKRPKDRIEKLIQSVKQASVNKDIADQLRQEGFEPEELMDGLKSSIINYMFNTATGKDGLNYQAALNTVFGPLDVDGAVGAATIRKSGGKGNRTPLVDILKSEGLFSQAELDRLQYILETGAKLQSSTQGGPVPTNLVDDTNLLVRAVTKIAGSTTATNMARTLGLRPQGLVEANVGAQAADKMINSIPEALQVDMLRKAVFDPKFLVTLLRKTNTDKQLQESVKMMNAYLIGAGLRLSEEDELKDSGVDETTEQLLEDAGRPDIINRARNNEDVRQRALELMNRSSDASQLSPSLNPSAPRTAAQQPQTRNRLASAFPSDGILGLMRT
jgi:hypothetical protein